MSKYLLDFRGGGSQHGILKTLSPVPCRVKNNINVRIKYVFQQEENALLLQRNMYQEDLGHVIDG